MTTIADMNIKPDHGGQAFPGFERQRGMTLRDYFAAKAMQSLTMLSLAEVRERYNTNSISTAAYIQADAMLKERDK
jgi:hypothetical protein